MRSRRTRSHRASTPAECRPAERSRAGPLPSRAAGTGPAGGGRRRPLTLVLDPPGRRARTAPYRLTRLGRLSSTRPAGMTMPAACWPAVAHPVLARAHHASDPVPAREEAPFIASCPEGRAAAWIDDAHARVSESLEGYPAGAAEQDPQPSKMTLATVTAGRARYRSCGS